MQIYVLEGAASLSPILMYSSIVIITFIFKTTVPVEEEHKHPSSSFLFVDPDDGDDRVVVKP